MQILRNLYYLFLKFYAYFIQGMECAKGLVLPGCFQNRITIIRYYCVEMAAGRVLVFAVLVVVVG